jgi:hypothetical protein
VGCLRFVSAFVEPLLPPLASYPQFLQVVTHSIAKNRVMIFSKSYCPHRCARCTHYLRRLFGAVLLAFEIQVLQ